MRLRNLAVLSLALALQGPVVIAAAATCGNGSVEEGEGCDDGNRFPGDCCSADCRVEESYLGCAGACLCDTCDDGEDNDGDGRVDAYDSECATLHALQPLALVVDDGAVVAVEAGARALCVADAPLGPDPNDEAICRDAGLLVAMESWRVARLDGASVDEIAVADGAAEAALSFSSGTTVLRIARLNLGAATVLRLVGEVDSTVVVQVAGEIALARGARVVLDGGLRSDRVLWSLDGGTGEIWLGEGARLAGTLLAPQRRVRLECNAHVLGGLYSEGIDTNPCRL